MIRFSSITLFILFILFKITNYSSSNLPEGTNWKLLENSSDEFDGDKLDRNKWNTHLWYDSSGSLAFDSSNISVKDGMLNIFAKQNGNNNSAWTIGAVESIFDIPGEISYVEVRAKLLPYKANVLSAIWLQTWPTIECNPNPEIDIHEYFYEKTVSMNFHEWNKKEDGTYDHIDYGGRQYQYEKTLSEDYHIWGLERINGCVRFYFDGNLLEDWLVPDPSFTKMPRHIVLSLEGHNGIPNNKFLPASFQIDYVRTYIHPTN